MKKNILVILSLLILYSGISTAYSQSNINELADTIKLYKSGNYTQCYVQLEELVKKDPSNPLVYYYLGMTYAQLGRGSEAISNYERAISLSSRVSNINRYARKGKRCIESPSTCQNDFTESIEEAFVTSKKGPLFSDEAKSEFERLKIENFMREMNRNDSIDPKRFKEYKDFSSVPTNDEIVAAFRVLQSAGFGNFLNNHQSDLSFLTGNSQQNSMLNMMGTQNMNPQFIQALLTQGITQGF
jgi:tetratricopeptide (TPR) repeat protein